MLGIFLGTVFTYVIALKWHGVLFYTDAATLGVIAVAWLLICMVLLLGIYAAGSCAPRFLGFVERALPDAAGSFWARVAPRWSVRHVLGWTGIVFVLWVLIYFVFLCPVLMDYDTLVQLFEYATDEPVYYVEQRTLLDARFVDHHPFLTTLVFGAFWDLGRALGNQAVGYAHYALLQGLFTCFTLVLSVCYLERLKVPAVIRLANIAFIVLFPPIGRFAGEMVKDSLFSPFFVLWFIGFVEVFRGKGKALKNPWFVSGLILVACLAMLTKKTGPYVIVPSAFVLLIVFRKQWLPALTQFIVPPVLAMALFPMIVFPLFNVVPGGIQEMLGPLFQQTAAFAYAHPDEAEDWEIEAIDGVLAYDKLVENYNVERTDHVKGLFKRDSTRDDIMDYLRAWFSQGLRHPEVYLNAYAATAGELVVPISRLDPPSDTGDEFLQTMVWFEGPADVDVIHQDEWDSAIALQDTFFFWTASLWGPFGTKGFYGGWLPTFALAALLFARKRLPRHFVWSMTPIVLSVLLLTLSPTPYARYVLPLVYLAPLFVGLLTYATNAFRRNAD